MLNISQSDQNQYVRILERICMLHRKKGREKEKTQRDENERRKTESSEKLTGA